MAADENVAEQAGKNRKDINSAFFARLETLPLSIPTAIVAIFLVVIFFISGADANTYVLEMLSTRASITL